MQPRSIDPTGFYYYDSKLSKFVYYVRAPRIKYGVVSGGGAKGATLPGVIEVLENHFQDSVTEYTLMEGFDCMIGSSVGAMTAALLAAGITSDTLKKKAKESGGKELLGTGRLNAIHFDAIPLANFIRDNMWASIRNRLCNIHEIKNADENMNQLITCLQQDKNHNQIILAPVFDYLNNKNIKGKIPFSLLNYLHTFAPKYFKNLIVTATYIGTTTEEGKLYFFSNENTPNLDTVTASMASGALPKVIRPVVIAIEELKGGKLEKDRLLPTVTHPVFVDGGYLDNIPVSCISDLDKNDGFKKLEVLVIVFDQSPKTLGQSAMSNVRNTQDGVFKVRNRDRLICDVIPKYGRAAINTPLNNTYTKRETLERIREDFTQRVILLESDLTTIDFDKAAEDPEKYHLIGKRLANEQLSHHQDEFVCYYEADSEEELLAKIASEYFLQILQTLLNIPYLEKKVRNEQLTHHEDEIDYYYQADSEKTLPAQNIPSYQNTQSIIRKTLSVSPPSVNQNSICLSITNNILGLDGIKNASLTYSNDKLGRNRYKVLYDDLHDNLNNQFNENNKVLNILKILLTHYYDALSSKDLIYKAAMQDAINYLILARDDVFSVYLKINLGKYSRLKNMHILLEKMHPDQYLHLDKKELFSKFVKFLELIVKYQDKFWEGKATSRVGRTRKIPDLIKQLRPVLNNPTLSNEKKYYQLQSLMEQTSQDAKDAWLNEAKDLYQAICNCSHLPQFSKTNYLDAFLRKYFKQENIQLADECVPRNSL